MTEMILLMRYAMPLGGVQTPAKQPTAKAMR